MKRVPRSTHKNLRGGAAIAAAAIAFRHVKRKSRFAFAGKIAVVTGGSRGLGLLISRELIRRGARVAVLARDSDELHRAETALRRQGGQILAMQCDVTDSQQVATAFQKVREQMGEIHVLVNNAGWIGVGPMQTMTVEDFRHSLDLHFWAALFTTLEVLPEMRALREGRIVNISSIGGQISVPHLLPYSTGKFALAGFSEGLRSEAIRDNIYVTTVYPGLMRTGSPRQASFKGKHRAEYAWFSLAASLPPLSIDAQRAAKQVVDACERGDATLRISVPAKLAIALHHLFPNSSAAVLGWTNRLLPSAGGIGSSSELGMNSSSALSPSWLTTLNERAAERNNEVA